MASVRLLDVEKKERWTGRHDLLPVDRQVCPSCGGDLREETVAQPALLRHGGYGATEETTSVSCRRCGWHLTVAVCETRLVGDEGYGPTVIEVTAVGESRILAKALSHNGVVRPLPSEGLWVLHCRDWQVA
jgi:hypothetical protein